MAVDPIRDDVAPGSADVISAQTAGTARQKWTLTQNAFDSLLAALSPARDTAGTRYLDLRRNLVRLFEWRGCPTPDEYADEAINRCAKKISDGEEIRDIGTYCIGVARMLVRESARDRLRESRPLDEAPEPRAPSPETEGDLDQRVDYLRQDRKSVV